MKVRTQMTGDMMPTFKITEVADRSGESVVVEMVKEAVQLDSTIKTQQARLKTIKSSLEKGMTAAGVSAVCVGPDLFWGVYRNASKWVPDMDAIEEARPGIKALRLQIETLQAELAEQIENLVDAEDPKFLVEKPGSQQNRSLTAVEIEIADGTTWVKKPADLMKLCGKVQ